MMAFRRDDADMRCPKCARFELKEQEALVRCAVCGYELSPGQQDKFRLYRTLKKEGSQPRTRGAT